jgi:hypothetical protein
VRENAIVVPVSALRRIFIGVVVLILLIVVVLVVRNQLFRVGLASLLAPSVSEQIDRNAYQAVFLTGGQVFFGKLQQENDEYFLLYDVFYLSVPDQPGAQGQLIKRGNELHGPKEPMIIPARDVLFIENLRDDGEVAVAIRKFKAGQLPAVTPPPITAAPTTAPSTARPSPSPTR